MLLVISDQYKHFIVSHHLPVYEVVSNWKLVFKTLYEFTFAIQPIPGHLFIH